MAPLILFDGVCNFCDATINFVIRHDKKDVFRFAPLQSATGIALLEKHTFVGDSFVLVEDGKVYQRSTAALRVARRMGFPWNMAYALIIIPKPLRDGVYKWIAKNRYKWFGKKDVCMIPDQKVRAKFVDG